MTTDPFPRTRLTGVFERRAARALALLPTDARVVVACSGGPDSTAALVAVTRSLGAGRVTAACFDHRLRPPAEVAGERAIVEQVAAALGVPVRLGRAATRPADGSEAAAREARYRWLARACADAGAVVCLTGHTLDDQAETVLLRLARGSGAEGLAGMAAEATWPVVPPRGVRAPRLFRPLLDHTRLEVEAYLRALGIQAAEDPSNASMEYARNRVRREVMPALRALNPRAAESIAAFASRQREDDEALTAIAEAWLAAHPPQTTPGAVGLDRLALRSAAPAVAARVVRLTAARRGVRVEAAHVTAIRRLAERSSGTSDLPLARTESIGNILWLRERPPTSGRTGNGPRR
ncbi:MAG: tRNA lysidine(34) synthetase TilS [Dehalococcoidia bacterium]|nr:tRNA lysidine(34) synthetase TilS [Dehalococcoidia bacterium]